MFLLLIGLIVTVSLVIILSVALSLVKYVSNRRAGQHDGVQVKATVIDVQAKQDWRDGERWVRDAWSGALKRERTWQSYYDITVQWAHPQTGQMHTFRKAIWANDVTKAPTKGDSLFVSIDPGTSRRYRVVISPSPTVPHAPSPSPAESPSPVHSATGAGQ